MQITDRNRKGILCSYSSRRKDSKSFSASGYCRKKARLVMNKEDAINSHSELEFVLDIQKSDVKRMIEENIW